MWVGCLVMCSTLKQLNFRVCVLDRVRDVRGCNLVRERGVLEKGKKMTTSYGTSRARWVDREESSAAFYFR